VAAVALGSLRRLPLAPLIGVSWEWILTPFIVILLALSVGKERLSIVTRDAFASARAFCLAALADLIWTLVSASWSIDQHRSLLEGARTLSTTVAAFVFAAALNDGEVRRRALLWVVRIGAAVAALSIAITLLRCFGFGRGSDPFEEHSVAGLWPRATGGIGSPGWFGMTMLVLLGLAFVADAERVMSSPAARLVQCLAIVACLMSASIPSLATVVWLVGSITSCRYPRIAWFGVTLTTCLALLAVYVHVHEMDFGSLHFQRSPELGYVPLGYEVHPIHAFKASILTVFWHETGYLACHRAHFRVAAMHPFGVGAGTFEVVDVGPILRSVGYWSSHARPHSWVLSRLSECGIPGVTIALAASGLGLAWIAKHRRLVNPARGSAATVLVSALLSAMLFGEVHEWSMALLVAAVAISNPPLETW
jgi:hypothetical protein